MILKDKSPLPRIVACLLVVVVAALVFPLGLSAARKATAEDHARWIARYWKYDAGIDVICADINREHKVGIVRAEWEAGDGVEVVRGPVVDGMRIYIHEDGSLHWRATK